MLRSQLAQAEDVAQVHPLWPTQLLGQVAALTAGQVPCFVAVDVEPARRECRQQVSEQLVEQLVRLFARRRNAPAPANLVQVRVLRQAEHCAQVAERLQIG